MIAPERLPPGAAGRVGVELVPLARSHLDQVLDIERRVAVRGWARQIFEAELADHESRCYLVAQTHGPDGLRVLAYAGMQLQVDEAHITTMTVDPAHRRQGLASRLLLELLREARARGASAATLEVRVNNRAAQRLYARFGFRPVGIRPNYYEGKVDALVMWAHDVDSPDYGRLLRERDPAWTVPLSGRAGIGGR